MPFLRKLEFFRVLQKERKTLGQKKVLSWEGLSAEGVGKDGSIVENSVCVDARDCVLREVLGILQYSLIGKWKTKPMPLCSTKEMEAWARAT